MSGEVTRLRPPKPCPVCGKPSVQKFHPFCSTRCADIDLGRWLKGSYVIPGKDGSADENTMPSDDQDEDN